MQKKGAATQAEIIGQIDLTGRLWKWGIVKQYVQSLPQPQQNKYPYNYFPILVYTSIEVQQHDLFHRWKHGEAYNSVAIESDQWQSK